tara:strand:+ start:438 stop:680 length:243 start_codon:yes stop_codon:yes gene_type:complete
MEILSFCKTFDETNDITEHLDVIWMSEVLDFCDKSNHKIVDIDVNMTSIGSKYSVLVIYKTQPEYYTTTYSGFPEPTIVN